MDTPKQTFPMAMKSVLHNSPACDRINTNKGWRLTPDGKIESTRPSLVCPRCKLALGKLLPETEAKNLVVYCKRCKQESIVNISSVPVP